MLAIVIGLGFIFVLSVLRHSGTKFTPTGGTWLQIQARHQIPLLELSGIARFGDKLYLVGDKRPELAVVDYATMEVLEQIDFSPLLQQRFSLCLAAQNRSCDNMLKALATQWEGIYVDDNGIAILQENSGSVLVFDLQMTATKEHILVDYRHDKDAQENDNSLGEGLLIDADRVLIAKEKSPTAIMEFTVAKQTHHTGIIRKEMQATHTWLLTSEDKRCDLSDLAPDPHGSGLYGISQTCHSIYKFKALSKDYDKLIVERQWRIPDEVIAPEALLVNADGTFIVCSDSSQEGKDNVFVLY